MSVSVSVSVCEGFLCLCVCVKAVVVFGSVGLCTCPRKNILKLASVVLVACTKVPRFVLEWKVENQVQRCEWKRISAACKRLTLRGMVGKSYHNQKLSFLLLPFRRSVA